MNNNNSLISVIVPTFNREHLLKQTVGSILGQSYKNIEVIVVDDGSTDGTGRITKVFADNRIRYFRNERVGDISRIRNIGVEYANGDIIAFCDDDDLWFPHKLQKQLPFMNEFDLICSNADIIDGKGKCLGEKVQPNETKDKIVDTRTLFLGNIVITSSVLIRKDKLSHKFTERGLVYSAEDYELWIKLSLQHKIYFIADSLVLFRRHSNTTSFDYSHKYIRLLDETIKILKVYKSDANKKIGLYSRIGIVRYKKELCKVLVRNKLYKAFFKEVFSLLFLLINFNVSRYFIVNKFKLFFKLFD